MEFSHEIPEAILDELENVEHLKVERLKEFVRQVPRRETRDLQFRIATGFYNSWLLKVALDRHAKALTESAEASDRHARSLKFATWALFVATVALVIVASIQVYSA